MLVAGQLNLQTLRSRCYWTYVLIDPRNDEIKYVGRSVDPRKRLREHQYSLEARGKRAWISELKQLGLEPQIGIVESAQTEDIAVSSERHWIKYCLERGANLLNDPRFERQTGGRPRRSGK